MIQFIIGEKGKGKTKVLLEKANAQIKEANGNIVYLDKSAQHMYELNNRIRLIDVTGYPLTDSDEFIGFICGIISQDHDLQQMYFDSFLKIAHLEGKDITKTIKRIEKISAAFGVNFFVSVSLDEEDVPDELKELIEVSL